MGQLQRSFAKSTSTGRFVSKAEAAKLLAQAVAVNDENNDGNIIPPVVVRDFTSNTSGVPRRQRSGSISAYAQEKIRSLELSYARERARSANFVAKVDEERQLRMDETADLQLQLTKAKESNANVSTQLRQAQEALRQAKARAVAARALIAKARAAVARRSAAKARDRMQKLTTTVSARHRVTGRVPQLVTIPPPDTGASRARYDFCRRNAIKLQKFLAAVFADGPDGESALGVLSYSLALRPKFTAELVMDLGIPQAIEHEVCKHLQNELTPEKGAELRMQAGLTWRGYKAYSMRTFRRWDERLNTWTPIDMPYGNAPPQPARAYKVDKWERDIVAAYGLNQSEDGLTAWCDCSKVMESRLEAIPEEQLPSDQDITSVWFGADGFRGSKQDNTKFTMCAAKPIIERRSKKGLKRLEGWVANSEKNHIRLAIYEGSDTYEEFTGKASIVKEQLQKLKSTPLRVKGKHYKVELGLFGDMAFLNQVQGGSGCNSREPCIECDVANSYLHYSPTMFTNAGMELPKPMDYDRRCRLAHAYGEEYNITQPYVCEGCQKTISEHGMYAPQTKAEHEKHMHIHFSQRHGKPPPFGIDQPNIVACSMHGEHNILAHTWYATITQNITDKATMEKVNAVVCDRWKMKKHVHKVQNSAKPCNKDSPHFNGPEGVKVLARRKEVLDIVLPSGPRREMADKLWEAQDALFESWRRPAAATQEGRDQHVDDAAKHAETVTRLFTRLCAGSDGTVTHHYAMFHWPRHIRIHGSLSVLNAQGLEACNQDGKQDLRNYSNRQTIRLKKDGTQTRARVAQILAKAMIKTLEFAKRVKEVELKRHKKTNVA